MQPSDAKGGDARELQRIVVQQRDVRARDAS